MKKSIFLFFAAILCAMSASAKNVTKPRIYYDNSNTSYSSVAFVVGHNSYSRCYKLTKISNTNLWYRYLNGTGNDSWTDATQIAVFGVDWDSSEGSSISNRLNYTGDKYTKTFSLTSDLNSGKVYLVTAAGNKSNTSIALQSGGYTDLNYTQTVQQQLTTDGTTYNLSTEAIATVSVTSYKLSDYAITASNSGTIASGTSSATCSAARTATVTYTVSGVDAAYSFVGWYDGGTQKSTASTYTTTSTGAKTITARFAVATEEEHEVAVSYMCGTTKVADGATAYVGVETEKSFTAPTNITGYKFTNWTIGAGITLKTGATTDATIGVVTKSASSNYTLVANYEEVMETIYFINTGNWSVVNLHRWNGTAAATSWPGEAMTKTGEKIGEYDVYSFTAKQGDFANVIFTNKNTGSDQTADLTWTAGKYYIYKYGDKTGWYTYDEAVALLEIVPDYYITGTKELTGSTEWQANEIKMEYDRISKTHFYKFSGLATGITYQLKVTTGSWDTSWGYSAVKNPVAGVVDNGGNVGFKLSTAGDVTITFDGTNITVSTTGAFYVPVVYDYYIVGEMNSWSANEDYGLSDANADGIYEKELTWAAGTYIFKINVGDWNKQWGWSDVVGEYKEVQNANDDNKIKVVLGSEKTFTVKFNPTDKKISFANLTRPERYLTGNDAVFGYTDGNWTPNTIQMTWDEANGIYTYTTPTLNANQNYIFRVTNGTWDGKWGYDKLNPAPENVLSFGDDKNICFMLASAGTITVTLDGDKLGLTTSSSFAAPVYTLVGDAAITGVHWNVNSAENQMVQDATDKNKFTLVKTVTAVAGEYEYKAIRNHSYEWEVAGDKVKIEKDGTGKITYTLDIATPKLTAAVSDWVEESVAQVVTLVGIGDDKEFTENADHKTTSVAVSLEANSVYSFNIVANSVYLKNKGVMWRGNCEGWTFTNEGDKAHIITDLAGTYTFTWTYEGNKLSVTYPDGTNVPAPVFLAGEMNGWERLATRLIPSADGKTASATIKLQRNAKSKFRMVIGTEDWTNPGEMKRTNCSGWTFEKVTESNKEVNASILPDATGDYTFTWTYADNKLSVTYPAEVCTDCSGYYLVGSMNNWNQLADEFMKTTGTAVEIAMELTAGSYEFKIKNNDTWYTNAGVTITRADNVKQISSTSGDNTKFTADIDGVYTFTYTTDQKNLTITYPEIVIGDGDNSTILSLLNGKMVDLTVTRSFVSGTLYTLVLPFAMDNSTVINVFGANVELYDFTSLSENTSGELILSFTKQATPAIAAGTPYLIKPATNANGFDLTGVTINTATTPVAQTYGTTTITMQPVLSAAAEDKTNGTSQYWLAADNNLYNNVVSIKGLRVIFDVQTSRSNLRARAAFNENVETGVENITDTDIPIKSIQNGQLIIIRNGVKYNVQGQKL